MAHPVLAGPVLKQQLWALHAWKGVHVWQAQFWNQEYSHFILRRAHGGAGPVLTASNIATSHLEEITAWQAQF